MRLDRSTVRDSIARHIAEAGLARYDPDGLYLPGALPVIVAGRMPDSPDNVVLVNIYNDSTARDPDSANPDFWVQIRCRTAGRDIRTTDDLCDDIKELLHERRRYVMPGGVRVLLSSRVLATDAETDESGRYSRPDSYKFALNAS